MHTSSFLKVFFLFAALLASASAALAAPVLNGLAVHSELGKERFIAGLSVTTLSSASRDILITNEEKQIQVRVLADRMSSRSFKRMWIEGMAINASSSELSDNAQNMAKFSNMLKMRLVGGDIFTVSRSADDVKVFLNGVQLGEIDDVGFFDLLLRTWIGPVPLSSQFRDDLLAAGNISEALLARFDGTFPSQERIAQVEQNVASQASPEPRVAAAAPVATLEPVAAAPAISAPAAPTVSAPEIAAAGTNTPAAPELASPDVEQPSLAAADTDSAPETTPEPLETEPAPAQTALLDVDDLEDEEDEEDLDFTAESLLAQQLYIANLKKYSHRYLKYPRRALERSWEGSVRMNITIDRSGKVLEVVVTEEAKHSTLTKAAIKAANSASPFPPMPEELSGENFMFTLPVVFRLN